MVTDFIKVINRKLRLVKINRNFLVFLVFLAISIVFWFMQSIKEATEISITYALKIDNLPKKTIYTSEMPDEITVNYSGKGWDAFYYKFMKNEPHELNINYNDLNVTANKIIIDANAFRRAIAKRTPKGIEYKSTTPNKVEVYYSNGVCKRVPVLFDGKATTTAGRYLCGTIIKPDSVDVYAPNTLLNKVSHIKTEHLVFKELEDTISSKVALQVPNGMKVLPDSVEATLCVDIFTDKTVQIPIYSVNVPNSKIMRMFPLKANVTFLVSATLYDNITADDFLLVVDYKETRNNSKRCKLYVRQQPKEIRNLRISPEYVEYVIEQATE